MDRPIEEVIMGFEEGSEIVIPLCVLKELDKYKNGTDDRNLNSRCANRFLSNLMCFGSLKTGVDFRERSVRVCISEDELDLSKIDNQIIAKTIESGATNTLVTQDINLKVVANALGVPVCSPDMYDVELDKLYNTVATIFITDKDAIQFIKGGSLEAPKEFISNQFIEMIKPDGDKLYGIYCELTKYIYPMKKAYKAIGIKPKVNKDRTVVIEQAMYMHYLLESGINLVSCVGEAGTGKTLLAIATGLEQVLKKKYDKLLIVRPLTPLGEEIGFLPGDKQEKLAEWMASAYDNLEYIVSVHYDELNAMLEDPIYGDSPKEMVNNLIERGIVEFEAFTYIRGRSIRKQFVICDDCFPTETKIRTENGRMTIGAMFTNFKLGRPLPRVLSFNEHTKRFEYKEIIRAMERGNKDLVEIHASKRRIKCTENHKFLTAKGWKEAGQIQAGEYVLMSDPNKQQVLKAWNEDQKQVVLGSFLGDGGISNHGLSRYRLRIAHSPHQENYCKWKASIFNREDDVEYVANNGHGDMLVRFSTTMFGIDGTFPNKKGTCPQWVLNQLNAKGLAIWFMDDGSVYKNHNGAKIWTCSFDEDSQVRMVAKLKEFGIDCYYKFVKRKNMKSCGYYEIVLSCAGYIKLCESIAPYVHPELSYKIKDYETYKHLELDNTPLAYGLTVIDKVVESSKNIPTYDIEVADNHNFVVATGKKMGGANKSGLVAHNCQNSTPHEATTLVTRIGDDSKLVILGDINKQQIDNRRLSPRNNGLVHVIDGLNGKSDIVAHISLKQVVRSKLAELAVKYL